MVSLGQATRVTLEHSLETRIMDQARADADDFLRRVREGLIRDKLERVGFSAGTAVLELSSAARRCAFGLPLHALTPRLRLQPFMQYLSGSQGYVHKVKSKLTSGILPDNFRCCPDRAARMRKQAV